MMATPRVRASTLFVALFRVTLNSLWQSRFLLKYRSFFSYRKSEVVLWERFLRMLNAKCEKQNERMQINDA